MIPIRKLWKPPPPLIYRIWSPSQVGLKALILTLLDIQRALTTNTLMYSFRVSILQLIRLLGEPLKGLELMMVADLGRWPPVLNCYSETSCYNGLRCTQKNDIGD